MLVDYTRVYIYMNGVQMPRKHAEQKCEMYIPSSDGIISVHYNDLINRLNSGFMKMSRNTKSKGEGSVKLEITESKL